MRRKEIDRSFFTFYFKSVEIKKRNDFKGLNFGPFKPDIAVALNNNDLIFTYGHASNFVGDNGKSKNEEKSYCKENQDAEKVLGAKRVGN